MSKAITKKVAERMVATMSHTELAKALLLTYSGLSWRRDRCGGDMVAAVMMGAASPRNKTSVKPNELAYFEINGRRATKVEFCQHHKLSYYVFGPLCSLNASPAEIEEAVAKTRERMASADFQKRSTRAPKQRAAKIELEPIKVFAGRGAHKEIVSCRPETPIASKIRQRIVDHETSCPRGIVQHKDWHTCLGQLGCDCPGLLAHSVVTEPADMVRIGEKVPSGRMTVPLAGMETMQVGTQLARYPEPVKAYQAER